MQLSPHPLRCACLSANLAQILLPGSHATIRRGGTANGKKWKKRKKREKKGKKKFVQKIESEDRSFSEQTRPFFKLISIVFIAFLLVFFSLCASKILNRCGNINICSIRSKSQLFSIMKRTKADKTSEILDTSKDEDEVESKKKPKLVRPYFHRDVLDTKSIDGITSLKIVSWNVNGLRATIKNHAGTYALVI